MGVWMDRCIMYIVDVWIYGSMDACMDAWMDGWMDAWVVS
jgi:hypothetical protein